MRRPRGNILITAIFISVFLFFLSVALVATNRMDLQLSLMVEHRLKAEAAARSGAHYALALMRKDPASGLALSEHRQTMDSGATFEVTVFQYRESQDSANYKYEISSKGRSGSVTVPYRLVVEETYRGPSDGQGNPYLCYLTGKEDELAVSAVGPDFVKRTLGPTPDGKEAVLRASGGPLFTNRPGGAKPVIPQAYLPVFSKGGGQAQVGPLTEVFEIPPGELLLELRLVNDELSWQEPTSLAETLGRNLDSAGEAEVSVQAPEVPTGTSWTHMSFAVVEDEEEANIRKHVWFDSTPGDGDDSSARTVRTGFDRLGSPAGGSGPWSSAPQRAPAEWYTLSGEFSADGGKLFSHGFHYVFVQYDGQRADEGFIDPKLGSLLVRYPTVMVYDSGGRWAPHWDPLRINGNNVQVEGEGLLPDPKYLLASEGRLFSTAQGDSKKAVRLEGTGWVQHGELPGDPATMVYYKNELYTMAADQSWPDGDPRFALRSTEGSLLSPREEFKLSLPEITAQVPRDGVLEPRTLAKSLRIEGGLEPGTRPASVAGHLYCLGLVRGRVERENVFTMNEAVVRPASADATVLLRYHEGHWEVWPSGLRAALLKGVGSPVPAGQPLNMAHYAAGNDGARRYTVIGASNRFSE